MNFLVLTDVAQAPRKEKRYIDSFAAFVRTNPVLEYLSMRGNSSTCIKADLIPIVEELAKNTTLVAVDIAGHDAGDGLGVSIGRFVFFFFPPLLSIKLFFKSSSVLKANKTLRALDYDKNGLGTQSLEFIRDGLDHNSTIQTLLIPVHDIANITKASKSSKTMITTLVRAIEAKIAANTAGAIVGASSSSPLASSVKSSPASAPLPIVTSSPRPLMISAGVGGDHRYINAARQKELESMVHRIRCTGRIISADEEKGTWLNVQKYENSTNQTTVFNDVAFLPQSLAALQTRQEAVMDQLGVDMRRIADKLAADSFTAIAKAHNAIQTEAIDILKSKYKSVPADASASIKSTLTTTCPPYESELISKAATELCDMSWRRLEAESSKAMLTAYSNFLYDSLQTSLETILNSIVVDAREAAVSRSLSSPGYAPIYARETENKKKFFNAASCRQHPPRAPLSDPKSSTRRTRRMRSWLCPKKTGIRVVTSSKKSWLRATLIRTKCAISSSLVLAAANCVQILRHSPPCRFPCSCPQHRGFAEKHWRTVPVVLRH